MSEQEEQMQRVIDVQVRYAEILMQKRHVVGVAVGLKKQGNQTTDQVCLVVMVDEKILDDDLDDEDRIPSEIEGVCVDV